MKDHCSYAPDWIYGYYIGDICQEHDMYYRDRRFKTWKRSEADKLFFLQLWCRLPWYLRWVAVFYYVAVRLFAGHAWEER